MTAWEQAQQAVLGACLIDSKCVPAVLARTKATDFGEDLRPVWLAVASLFRSGQPVDPVTVSHALGGDSTSRELMLQLMQITPTSANAAAYLDVLTAQSQLAAIRAAAQELTEAADLERARTAAGKISDLMADRTGVEVSSFADLAADFLQRHGEQKPNTFLPWGMDKLDENLFVREGNFVILGGYPSEGKTALALQFALHQSKTKRVGIFSLETRAEPLFDRAVSNQSSVNLGSILRSELREDDYEQILPSLRTLADRKLYIFRAASMTVQDISALSVAHQLDVIYIDYVQLITPDNERDVRHEQVAKISRDLHRMAQSTGIVVVALSQLSRPAKTAVSAKQAAKQETMEVPEPTMQSLRESGQLEQDADLILLLWRPYPELKSNQTRRLKVAKQKDGISNVKIMLDFDGTRQRFAFKDPRSLQTRVAEAARDAKAAKLARERGTELKQMELTELAGEDPDLPF